MAATGKTPILLYGSTTATNQPSAGNLTNSSEGCEIAINVADKNLFFKDATNTVNTVPIRQSSASSNGWLSSTDWATFNNKVSSQWVTSGSDIYYTTGKVAIGTSASSFYHLRLDGSPAYFGMMYGGTQAFTFGSKSGGGVDLYYGSGNVTTGSIAADWTITNGNLVIGTSGKGIDFSATAGTGTSELLADYEEGTWTPTQGAGLTVVGAFSSTGTYTKIGRQVTIVCSLNGSTSIACSLSGVLTGNLPYTPANASSGSAINSNLDGSSPVYVSAGNVIYTHNAITTAAAIVITATYFV